LVGGSVGGRPETIAAGGHELGSVSRAVTGIADGIRGGSSSAAGACGDGRLTGSIERFGTALARTGVDLGIQLDAASQLAVNAAADLATAGGEQPR
jgi:hypothetical protein